MRLSLPPSLAAVALLAVLTGTPALAEPAQIPEAALEQVKTIQAKALAGSGAYRYVESLTTHAGPRLVGTPGDALGVAWALEAFRALGLDDVRAEPVTVEGWLRGAESVAIVSPSPQPIVATALGGSAPTPPGGVEGEVVHFDSYEDLKAAPPERLAGKIALVTQRIPRTQDGAGYGMGVVTRTRGPSEAARKGALALMIRSVGTLNYRFAHTGMVSWAEGVPRLPAVAISNPDADQILRLMEGGNGPVRVRLTLDSKALGPVVTHNVMAEIKGREAPDEIVVLGAHLDSWDLGTGALDDGAGVGIVLASAKILKAMPERPRRTIRFILFGAEEVGLVGARAYAAAYKDSLDKHVVGTEADFGAGPVYGFSTRFGSDGMGSIPVFRRALAPLGITPGGNTATGGPDMTPLREAQVPVVTLALDGRDYFDVHHTPNDVIDRVDGKALDQSTAAYASFTWLAAQSSGSFRGPPPADPAQ